MAEDVARLTLWAGAGAGKGVLDSNAVYVKAELLLGFKYCLKDVRTKDRAFTVTEGAVDL